MCTMLRTVGLGNKLHEVDPLLVKFEALIKMQLSRNVTVIISSISHSDVEYKRGYCWTSEVVRDCGGLGNP